MSDALHEVTGDRLSAVQLHDILRLRAEVFVVEQDCAYQDVDGLDLRSDTTHAWLADDTGIAAYLRVLTEGQEVRIGRVVTRRDRRGAGVSRMLVGRALGLAGSRPTMLSAQSHLRSYYESFGFRVVGAEFVEDGIPHLPMERR